MENLLQMNIQKGSSVVMWTTSQRVWFFVESLGELEQQLITQALCRPYIRIGILEIPQATFIALWITFQSS